MAIRLQTSPGQTVEVTGNSATIGRDPDCTVAYPDDPRLQDQHAVLRNVSGRWMIEAKGQQLLQVGGAPPARVHWLGPGDVVRLTADGPELVFEPKAAQPETPAAASSQIPESSARPSASALTPAVWLAGAAVLIAIVVVAALMMLPPADTSDAPQQSRAAAPAADGANDTSASEVESDSTPSAPQEEPPAVTQEQINSALYTIAVTNPDHGQVFQLGTGWALSEHHLVTSAAIAMAMETLQDRRMAASVRSPVHGSSLVVVNWKVHPDYLTAVADADGARRLAENLAEQLAEAADDEKPALSEQLDTARVSYQQAIARQVFFDLAVVEVAEKLPVTLTPQREYVDGGVIGTRVTLAGIPFNADDYLVDPDAPAQPIRADARVFALSEPSEPGAGAGQVIVRGAVGGPDDNWTGSPLLNRSSNVIAVYSRPGTAPATAVDQPPGTNLHIATPLERLGDFAPELLQVRPQ